MTEHYDIAIIPARVRTPKDKPNAEGAVGNISIWITAALRNLLEVISGFIGIVQNMAVSQFGMYHHRHEAAVAAAILWQEIQTIGRTGKDRLPWMIAAKPIIR